MRVPAAGEDQKAVVFGAVDYATGQVLWQTSARKGEAAFSAFLDYLAEALPADEPVVLVLDNVGYHKSHALREVWRRYANRLEPFFLPAYAPQLNLIERLWHSGALPEAEARVPSLVERSRPPAAGHRDAARLFGGALPRDRRPQLPHCPELLPIRLEHHGVGLARGYSSPDCNQGLSGQSSVIGWLSDLERGVIRYHCSRARTVSTSETSLRIRMTCSLSALPHPHVQIAPAVLGQLGLA